MIRGNEGDKSSQTVSSVNSQILCSTGDDDEENARKDVVGSDIVTSASTENLELSTFRQQIIPNRLSSDALASPRTVFLSQNQRETATQATAAQTVFSNHESSEAIAVLSVDTPLFTTALADSNALTSLAETTTTTTTTTAQVHPIQIARIMDENNRVPSLSSVNTVPPYSQSVTSISSEMPVRISSQYISSVEEPRLTDADHHNEVTSRNVTVSSYLNDDADDTCMDSQEQTNGAAFLSPLSIKGTNSSGQLASSVQRRVTLVKSLVNIASSIGERDQKECRFGLSRTLHTSPLQNAKRIKIEETTVSDDVAKFRKLICDQKRSEINSKKNSYIEHISELFFLQNGGNMMDYLSWKKRPSPQLLAFLKANALSPSEDADENLKPTNNVVSSCESSDVVTLPLVPQVRQQGGSLQGRDIPEPVTSTDSLSGSPVPSHTAPNKVCTALLSTTELIEPKAVSSTNIIKPTVNLTVSNPSITTNTSTPTKAHRMGGITCVSPVRLQTRQHSISAVYDSSIGSQEEIVERAKQEAYVMQRISELRKEGLWSEKRLPKVQEAPRTKAHWDYLLEEMVWLATDFAQERKWKKAAAKKCARMCQKYHQEQKLREERAEKEAELKLKRIASAVAKEIKQFWTNVEKLVEYKQQSRLEEKRKKALDLHLNFIVDQTEKYSSWLAQGMNKSFLESNPTSIISSVQESFSSSPDRSSKSNSEDDADFEPMDSEGDDEDTIAKEEEHGIDERDQQKEIELLQKESEVPLEDLLSTLPQKILEKPASPLTDEESVNVDKVDASGDDKEFCVSSDDLLSDDEATLEEQEEMEKEVDHSKEIEELQKEGEMSIEELMEAYAPAFKESDTDGNYSEEDDEEREEDDERSVESQTEDESLTGVEDDSTQGSTDAVGLSSLMDSNFSKNGEGNEVKKCSSPTKEITDIAADAESFQPKGYTYLTAQVATKVPFLLKHQLREYQHIGLDWLVTMHERKLNGILADEMGLGKTIQTIALLAHLACEKGIWGPHLIVVPTSVMLNWEMEFKKWCPAFKILTYYGSQKERKMKRQGWTKPNAFHVCITSYKLVIQDHQSFRRKRWKYFILDEAQNIKNFKSQRWQLLLNFQSQWRLLLTGTPLQNSLMELWSLMHFLMPNVFQSHRDFKEWFANPLSGMIEGSREYNENLIKRLHKVLRPFLLRRLKSEVEKQLPRKFEHIIMCRMSKRQRFLYDDFMSQTKTKETLASGNFMSVINVLMQLRKVCNHPNMFESRPTVSPFQMMEICYWTSSLVYSALDYDPFKHVSLYSLNLLLADLELTLTAFAAHRIKRFQTPKKLIEEIDSSPDCPPKCPPGKIKLHVRTSAPVTHQGFSGRSSPLVVPQQRVSSPSSVRAVSPLMNASSGTHFKTILNSSSLAQAGMATSTSQFQPLSGYTFQLVQQQPQEIGQWESGYMKRSVAKDEETGFDHSMCMISGFPEKWSFANWSSESSSFPTRHRENPSSQMQITNKRVPIAQLTQSQVVTSTPITVQIQQTQQGPRITVPAGQLAHIPAGFAQILQTSTGQHILLTSNPQAILQPVSASSGTTFSSNSQTLATVTTVTTTTTTTTTVASVSKSLTVPSNTVNKPIMRVSPLNVVSPMSSNSVTVNNKMANVVSPCKPVTRADSINEEWNEPKKTAANSHLSLFFLESIEEKKIKNRKEKLALLAKFNTRRCEACPIYGSDLIKALSLVEDVKPVKKSWQGTGYIHCLNANEPKAHPSFYWYQTEALEKLILTPEKRLQQLTDVLSRFVYWVPAVAAPRITMHVSHPSPSKFLFQQQQGLILQRALSPLTAMYHSISSGMLTQFPDPRLIQYDCGKLQTLDLLLRRLKHDNHRVLIFTQMTRMLDVLEQFLNYHGHIYLRLDGTTRVEQRQALMERFNADKRIFCFILSTRSGGIGVNLTGADTVIFYDSDWNPTMDAQAQDRCHRIGQTRDVHIYRLISRMTVEENILRKANQKRLLGEVAIEGGNFTTAFFRKTTIKELFDLDFEEIYREEDVVKKEDDSSSSSNEKITTAQLEYALAHAEEEMDVQAAKTAKAEAAAELAEFDESIPYDGDSKGDEEYSKVEEELGLLMAQLTPVERYAMVFLESIQEPFSLEQLKQAEEEIEAQKKDWELGRLQALKEEEERRALLDDEDVSFTYSCEDAHNQVPKYRKSKSKAKANFSQRAYKTRRKLRSLSSKNKIVNGEKVKNDKGDREGDDSNVGENVNYSEHCIRGTKNVPDLSTNHISLNKYSNYKISLLNSSSSLSTRSSTGKKLSISPTDERNCYDVAKCRVQNSSPLTSCMAVPLGSPKNSSNVNNCEQPISSAFSNPELVIRTRRASAREALCHKEKSGEEETPNSLNDHIHRSNSWEKTYNKIPDRLHRRKKLTREIVSCGDEIIVTKGQ